MREEACAIRESIYVNGRSLFEIDARNLSSVFLVFLQHLGAIAESSPRSI